MDKDLQLDQTMFSDLLDLFYRKILRYHPRRKYLLQQYKKIISNFVSNEQVQKSESSNFIRVSVSNNSFKSNRSIVIDDAKSDLSGSIRATKRGSQIGFKYIHYASTFEEILSYASIYSLTQSNNINGFNAIQEKINSDLEINSDFNRDQLRNITTQWSKISQMMLQKNKIRWQKIITDFFSKLPFQFIKIIFKCVTDNTETINEVRRQLLQNISKKLKLNMIYFVMNGKTMIRLQKMVKYQKDLHIGCLKDQNIYIFTEQLPKKSDEDSKHEQINRKIIMSLQYLLTQYDKNTEQLLNSKYMSFLSQKNQKINHYLECKTAKSSQKY